MLLASNFDVFPLLLTEFSSSEICCSDILSIYSLEQSPSEKVVLFWSIVIFCTILEMSMAGIVWNGICFFFPQFQLHELTVFLIRAVIVLFNRIILLFKSMSNSHSDPGASFFVNGCILIGNRSFICSILNWLISAINTPIKKLKQQWQVL